jgi:hypothetical protein
MLNWQYFPKSDRIPNHLQDLLSIFNANFKHIRSDYFSLKSDEVLNVLELQMEEIGFLVEKSKRAIDKIHVPVLFGRNGVLEKYFEADAFHAGNRTVVEIEAGRAVANFQFLKDLFQASMMKDVDYLVIAVRNIYRNSKDFDKVISFLETLYSSNRLVLPLKGILIVGY